MNIDPKLREIADKVEAGVRLELRRRHVALHAPRPAGRRPNGQSGPRTAAWQHHVLQPQPPSQYDERLRGELRVLLVRAVEGGHAQRLHDEPGTGLGVDREALPAGHDRGPHRQRPEPALAVQLLYRSAAGDPRPLSGLAPEGLYGRRDPLLRPEIRHVVSRGAGATDRRRPRFAAGRRGRDLRPAGAKANLPRQGRCRRLARHPSHGPPVGAEVELHDALRHDRDPRGADRPPHAAAGIAGRNGRLPGLRAAGLPSRGQPAAEARGPDGRRRPAR